MKRNYCIAAFAILLATVAVNAQTGTIGNVVKTGKFGDMGNVTDKRCSNGRVAVNGTGNVVTVAGYCPVAVISGTGNVLNIERVGRIEIKGTGNVVQYRYLNPNPKNAKTKVHPAKIGGGMGNSVSWTKGAAFADYANNSDDEE